MKKLTLSLAVFCAIMAVLTYRVGIPLSAIFSPTPASEPSASVATSFTPPPAPAPEPASNTKTEAQRTAVADEALEQGLEAESQPEVKEPQAPSKEQLELQESIQRLEQATKRLKTPTVEPPKDEVEQINPNFKWPPRNKRRLQ